MPAPKRLLPFVPSGLVVVRVRPSVRRGIDSRLRMRVERDVKDGVLLPGTQAAALAGLVLAVTQGMSVLARDGASRASLLAVVEAALRAWPGTEAADRAPAR